MNRIVRTIRRARFNVNQYTKSYSTLISDKSILDFSQEIQSTREFPASFFSGRSKAKELVTFLDDTLLTLRRAHTSHIFRKPVYSDEDMTEAERRSIVIQTVEDIMDAPKISWKNIEALSEIMGLKLKEEEYGDIVKRLDLLAQYTHIQDISDLLTQFTGN
jgi:hypothetical protein